MSLEEIFLTFCTLMLWLVLLKIKLAFIALANLLALERVSVHAHHTLILVHIPGWKFPLDPRVGS